MRFHTCVRATFFVAASQVVALCAHATDYTAGFSMNLNASHNDNIRLVQSDKTSVKKYDAIPVLTFSANTETTKLELDSTLDFSRYDKSAFNSDDQNIVLTLSHQFENSTIGLNAAFIRNSTVTSEQLTTGRIGDKAERAEQYQLSPNWQYTLNENNLVQLNTSYTIQDYHSVGYFGYKNAGAELDWIHIINERMKWITAVTYSDYRSDDITFDVPSNNIVLPIGFFGQQSYSTHTKSQGVEIGLDYQWSEQSLIKARLGRSKDNTTYPIKDSKNICNNILYLAFVASDFGPTIGGCNIPNASNQLTTAELDWTWSNERQQFSLNSTKSTQPTANGYTVDALWLGTNWSYQLNELDQISAALSLARNRATNSRSSQIDASIADRNYGSATLTYQRQIKEHWFLNASYQFSEQKYTQIDYQANSKVISLGIRYQPQQWHWSR